MPYKEHLKDMDNFSPIVVLVLGLWGAVMNFAKRKREEKSLSYKVSLFLFDVTASAGVAIITYLTVFGYTGNDILSVGISGVIAHQGTRGFYILEQIISQKLNVDLKKKL